MPVWLLVLASFGCSALLTWRFCDPRSRFHLLDHPNERSLHSHPKPRTGGVAITVSLLIAMPLYALMTPLPTMVLWIGLAAVLLAGMSFLDDRYGLPAGLRLVGHFVIVGMVSAGGLVISGAVVPGLVWSWPYWLAHIATALFLIWMINLYNFMDGMDGFAGGMAVIGFGAMAILGYEAGQMAFTAISLLVVAASAGFLIFNFPPARIFMGDTGSSLLGLLAGSMVLWADLARIFDLWIGILVFSPFIVDATVTLLRRLLSGEKFWEAHRTHFYQRLVRCGWGHRKTVLAEYGLMLACGGSAIIATRLAVPAQQALLLSVVVVYLLLVYIVSMAEKSYPSS